MCAWSYEWFLFYFSDFINHDRFCLTLFQVYTCRDNDSWWVLDKEVPSKSSHCKSPLDAASNVDEAPFSCSEGPKCRHFRSSQHFY